MFAGIQIDGEGRSISIIYISRCNYLDIIV